VRTELRQLCHANRPGEILFPAVMAETDYSDEGTLKGMTLVVVEQAQFNCEIPDDTFKVGMTGGAILDFRAKGRTRSVLIPDGQHVPDVVQRLKPAF
jgi:hypothetical protein